MGGTTSQSEFDLTNNPRTNTNNIKPDNQNVNKQKKNGMVVSNIRLSPGNLCVLDRNDRINPVLSISAVVTNKRLFKVDNNIQQNVGTYFVGKTKLHNNIFANKRGRYHVFNESFFIPLPLTKKINSLRIVLYHYNSGKKMYLSTFIVKFKNFYDQFENLNFINKKKIEKVQSLYIGGLRSIGNCSISFNLENQVFSTEETSAKLNWEFLKKEKLALQLKQENKKKKRQIHKLNPQNFNSIICEYCKFKIDKPCKKCRKEVLRNTNFIRNDLERIIKGCKTIKVDSKIYHSHCYEKQKKNKNNQNDIIFEPSAPVIEFFENKNEEVVEIKEKKEEKEEFVFEMQDLNFFLEAGFDKPDIIKCLKISKNDTFLALSLLSEEKEKKEKKKKFEKEKEIIAESTGVDINDDQITELIEQNEEIVEKEKEIEKLKKKIEEKEDLSLCCICFEKKKSIAFQPCGHLANCDVCAKKVKKCPLCRKHITFKLKIYL